MSEIVSRICELKTEINDTCRLNGREPIFHPSSENEKIGVRLSNFSSNSKDNFREFVTMVHKFIIEASGNGNRLPNHPKADSMMGHVRELRNHFLHVREYDKPRDVKKKFSKVGDIYQVLIGKRAPRGEDWQLLQTNLLREVQEGLENIAISPNLRKPQPQNDSWKLRVFEDNRIFIFGEKPAFSRIASKRGYLSNLAEIPVFIPDFTLVPPPHLGSTESVVYVTSLPEFRSTVSNFAKCVKEMESAWIDNNNLRATYSPFSWSLSEDNYFKYGIGSVNLIKELESTRRTTIGAIMMGCFGEHYNRTCLLVLYGYRKGDRVDVATDLYLSCIPADWEWITDLYNKAFKHIDIAEFKVDYFSIEPLRFMVWESKERRVKLDVIGGIRREGYGLSKEDRSTDIFTGTIIRNSSIPLSSYEITEKWNVSPDISLENPLKLLDESVISITNSVPCCDEIQAGKLLDVNAPEVKMMVFGASGSSIFGITVHSTGPRFKK